MQRNHLLEGWYSHIVVPFYFDWVRWQFGFEQCVPTDVHIYIQHSQVTPRPGAILRPTSDEVDIIDSDGSNWDIVTKYKDDVGSHWRYITWWGRTHPWAILLIDFPTGNPGPWRHAGGEEDPDISEDLGKEDTNDQENDAGEHETSGDGGDPNVVEGDQDGYDEGEGEEDEEDAEDKKDEEDEEGKEDEEDEEYEEGEEDESDAVPHHSRDDTIALDLPSVPSQGEKDPIGGFDSSPHHPMPTI